MATESVATVSTFTAPEGYQPPVRDENALDFAQRRVAQLSALLFMTYGGAGDEFRNSSASMQDTALWLAHDLAEEVDSALRTISPEPRQAAQQ